MADDIRTQRVTLSHGYAKLCELIPEYKEFSFTEFVDCATVSLSRAHTLDVNGERTRCLVPFTDAVRHSGAAECTGHYDEKKNGYVMRASKDIPFGSPIHCSFGQSKTFTTRQ